MRGQIVRAAGGLFTVRYYEDGEGRELVCKSRGSLKRDDKLYVGDLVEFAGAGSEGVIESVLPRKSSLTRPAVCNVTQVVVVLASSPAPDLLIVDKMLVTARRLGLKFVICVNKSDTKDADALYTYLSDAYSVAADGVVLVSASTGEGIERLKQLCSGELSCLCGQSAVGKSSLINAMTGLSLATDGLSRKIDRGKHTTRHAVLLPVGDGYIVDTPGFSLLMVEGIRAEELYAYYEDFLPLQQQCRFNSCTHTTEPNCGVLAAVEDGRLDRQRYERYKTIFAQLNKPKY